MPKKNREEPPGELMELVDGDDFLEVGMRAGYSALKSVCREKKVRDSAFGRVMRDLFADDGEE